MNQMILKSFRFCAIFLLLAGDSALIVAQSMAQEPATQASTEKRPKKWAPSIHFGLLLQAGQVDHLGGHVYAYVDYKGPVWCWEFRGKALFGVLTAKDPTDASLDESDSANRQEIDSTLRYLLTPKYYLFQKTEFDRNDGAGLDFSTVVGAGIGRNLIQTDKTAFLIEAGAGRAYKELLTEIARRYWQVLLGMEFRQTLSSSVKVYENFNINLDTEDGKDWKIDQELGWIFPVNQSFSIQILADLEYDNKPASGFDRLTLSTTVSFSIHM